MVRLGNHENIIKVYDILENVKITSHASKNQVQYKNAMIMELGFTDLFSLIKKSGRFSEATARYYFKELLDGIMHCHMKQIAHCDLKPENIVLDECATVKLIDFGLA